MSEVARIPPIGAHQSVAGGLHLAWQRITQVGGEVLQIFTRNQRQWETPDLTCEEISLFKACRQEAGGLPVVSHASYLINLATGNHHLHEKSVQSLARELRRCHLLDIPWLVLHPGSHGGDGIKQGLRRIVTGLDQALSMAQGSTKILLETTAGQGTGLGSCFEELAGIIEQSDHEESLGICFDTCHVFAAGYELRSAEGYQTTIAALTSAVGREKVLLIHLNDSKADLASRRDRHEHIGMGAIGLDGFRNLLCDPGFAKTPMVLETPKGAGLSEDQANLETLRTLFSHCDNSLNSLAKSF